MASTEPLQSRAIHKPSANQFFFIAEPSGKPQVTAAHNASSTAVYLEWSAPPVNSLHGEFLGYLLSFRPRDASPTQAEERRLADPSLKVK